MEHGHAEFAVKHLVGRPRPSARALSAPLLGPSFVPDVDSFPSGHATSVFAVATVFAAYYPRLRWPLYGLAAAVALGRVYLERHYVSDILAGATIGTIVATYFLTHRRVWLPRRLQRAFRIEVRGPCRRAALFDNSVERQTSRPSHRGMACSSRLLFSLPGAAPMYAMGRACVSRAASGARLGRVRAPSVRRRAPRAMPCSRRTSAGDGAAPAIRVRRGVHCLRPPS